MPDFISENLVKLKIQTDEYRRAHPYSCFHNLPTQQKFEDCPSKYKWIFGGNQSGKTTKLCHLVVKIMKQRSGQAGWYGSPSFELSIEGPQRKVWDLLDIEDKELNSYSIEKGFKNQRFVVRCPDGGYSVCSFKSYMQDRDNWQSATLDFVAFDEEPPWDIYQECIPRVAARTSLGGGYLIGAMTALKYKTRLVNLIYYSDPKVTGVKCFNMPTYENHVKNGGCYTDADLKRLESQYDKRDIPARMFGIPTMKSGLVYDSFEDRWPWVLPRNKEFEIPSHWTTYEAIDPHPHNPHCILFAAVEPNGRIWIYDYIKKGGSPKEIVPMMWSKRRRANGYHVQPESIRMDAHGGRNYMNAAEQMTYYDAFLEAGLEGLITVHIPVDVRILKVQNFLKIDPFLRTPRIIIFESVEPLVEEILSYAWDSYRSEREEDRKEIKQTPVKKNDHFVDGLGYIVGCGAPYIRPSGTDRNAVFDSIRVSVEDPQETKILSEEGVGESIYAT